MRPRASALGLAVRCVYPWTSGDPWPVEDDTPAIRWGNAVHHVADNGVESVGAAAELFGLDEDEATDLAVVARDIVATRAELIAGSDVWFSERRIAYDAIRGVSRHVGDEPSESEWHGSPDLAVRHGGRLLIVDWKSGRGTLGRRPSDLIQIRTYAVMVAALPEMAGVEHVDIAIGQVMNGEVHIVMDRVSPAQMLTWEADLFDIARKLSKPPTPNPGPWCGGEYCPARSTCPTTLAIARAADGLAAGLPLMGPIENVNDALAMRSAIDRMREFLNGREEAVKSFATREPLPYGGGRFWGLQQRDGNRKIDLAKALPVLEKHGLAEAIERPEPKVMIGAVETIARQKQKGLAPKVIAELEKVGAVTRGAPYGVFGMFTKKDEI